MKEVTVKVYELAELEDEVRNQVLEKAMQNVVTGDWYTPILQNFRVDMEEYGIIGADGYFTGFGSQGDGACFIAEFVDTDALIRKLYEEGKDISEDVLLESKNFHVLIEKIDDYNLYDHEGTVHARIHSESDHLLKEDLDKAEYVLTEWVREKSINLYQELLKHYYSLVDVNVVTEALADCLFFIDGRIANGYIDYEKTLEETEKQE
jgi:hypothetical protein